MMRGPVTYAAAPMQAYSAPAVTYATPVGMPTVNTVSYGAAPISAFDALDANHDGQLSQAEYAAAMGATRQTGAVVSYGAPPARSVIATDRRLLAGNIIAEQPVSREELLAQGRIIPDDQREAQLVQQAMQIPGYMSSPYVVGGPIGGGLVMHQQAPYGTSHQVTGGSSTHYVTGGTATHHVTGGSATHHVTGGSAVHGQVAGHKLEISILQANGLQHLNHFTGDNLYAYCEIVKRSGKKVQHCQTAQVQKTLDPVWNELHHLDGYEPGDDLKFTVYDHGLIGSKTEGSVVIHSQDFFPQGWEGELPLSGLQHASISVRIVPLM